MGHVMEHVAIELQNVAGSAVTYGRTRSIDGQPGHYNMVFQYKDVAVGRESSALALKLLQSLLPENLQSESAPGDDWDFASERDDFIRYAQRRAFGPSTQSLIDAAEAARHSVAALERIQPGAVWLWPLSAPDSGDHDRPHQQHRCRAGV